jgi:hypothetical protein
MRKLLIKLVLFLVMLVIMFIGNIMVFRSEFPMLVFGTLIMSLVVLILFPYEKFFNLK